MKTMWAIYANDNDDTPDFIERMEFPTLANAKDWLAENWRDHPAPHWVIVDVTKPSHEPRHYAKVISGELWFGDTRFR